MDLKKIKGLFVQGPEETQAKAINTASPSVTINQSKTVSTDAGTFDQKVFDSLMKALDDHNLPGEDYLEFLSALQAMQNIQMEEKIKIQSVLATLSTKGLTIQKVKESADYYKKVLLEEQKQFYVELNNQIEEQVKSKEKTITDLQEENKTKSQQIAKLTKEINDNQQKISEIQNLIRDSDSKIKTTETNFKKTFDFVVNQIDSNINKLS